MVEHDGAARRHAFFLQRVQDDAICCTAVT